jgi:hypothetical protein
VRADNDAEDDFQDYDRYPEAERYLPKKWSRHCDDQHQNTG